MKKIKILFALIFSIAMLNSCEKDEGASVTTNEISNSVSKEKLVNSKTNSDVEMVQYESFVLFFDKSDNELYFLQIESNASGIIAPSNSASNAYLESDGNTLIVEQSGGDLEYTFIENEIIGIGHIEYQSGLDNGLLENNNGQLHLTPDGNDYTPDIACKCFSSSGSLPNNCTAGGQGASSCSVSSNGGGGCSVSCPYEIPCCTVDNNFTYN